ncbi:formylglycine-generating enzyme required for sulfatase activity [Lewinella aquimaris]|uniref:Formylglycine-generating enzyme required for sulfatase activity n=1 Tax=Neolewinella aquimaris TaxID=1835722 RepID=A0A840EBD0_9BACT|nr:SUMF1/EgtB/PvdO family nonheme iron enzyme [Neolewinella aquimaris]MBB4078296.1 formylglycine-generating enzyme required for sulfatase activity [Neolewinella aquimaris]
MNNLLLFSMVLFTFTALPANNIAVSNIVLTDQNVGAGETTVQFDLSWENSWRISVGPANYDAAWVIIKYRVGGGPWRHANIAGVGTSPGGASVQEVDNLGAFVYRSGDGSGDVAYQDIQLVWDYGIDGVDDNAVVDVQVFALEMVYVPPSPFSLGTGGNILNAATLENGEFYSVGAVPLIRSPYLIDSEDQINVNNSVGSLYYPPNGGGVTSGDQLGPIPATFPKGYDGFYCAKYETSQAQYVAFFNTLTQTQRLALDVTGSEGKNSDNVSARNGVAWDETGNATTSLPDLPLNYVSNQIALAYLDWAGLRPMTELEFEKAGRGPADPIQSEFAWGTANIHGAPYALLNDGLPTEQLSGLGVGTGNAQFSLTTPPFSGPLRVGIFAASATNANREETGGSYYGIMELSGNLYERVVSVGNPEGRAFNGAHGDGEITGPGLHNVATWPTTNVGLGYRGGSHANAAIYLRLSDRNDAATVLTGSNTRLGFRGVRSAN